MNTRPSQAHQPMLKHTEIHPKVSGHVPLAPRWQGGTCPWYPGRCKAHRCRCPGSLLSPQPPGYFHRASGSSQDTARQGWKSGLLFRCIRKESIRSMRNGSWRDVALPSEFLRVKWIESLHRYESTETVETAILVIIIGVFIAGQLTDTNNLEILQKAALKKQTS